MKHFVSLLFVVPMTLAGAVPAAAEEDAPRCEPRFHESGIEPFGRIVTYRAGQEIRLPDFVLAVVATASSQPELRVRDSGGQDRSLIAPVKNAGKEPLEFELDGKHYVLETAHTVLYDRPLADDELVAWPREEYRALRGEHASH